MKIITFITLLISCSIALAQTTLPIEHTLTDKKERTLSGTITAKNESHITFIKAGSDKKIQIEINKLSHKDQAFISTLENKKTSILFYTKSTKENIVEPIEWLISEGFDVTIGVRAESNNPTRAPKIKGMPEDRESLTVFPLDLINEYDIVWINSFTFSNPKTQTIPVEEYRDTYIIQHAIKNNKLLVVKAETVFLSNLKYYEPVVKNRVTKTRDVINFVKPDFKTIFYNDAAPLTNPKNKMTPERVYKELLAAIKQRV